MTSETLAEGAVETPAARICASIVRWEQLRHQLRAWEINPFRGLSPTTLREKTAAARAECVNLFFAECAAALGVDVLVLRAAHALDASIFVVRIKSVGHEVLHISAVFNGFGEERVGALGTVKDVSFRVYVMKMLNIVGVEVCHG